MRCRIYYKGSLFWIPLREDKNYKKMMLQKILPLHPNCVVAYISRLYNHPDFNSHFAASSPGASFTSKLQLTVLLDQMKCSRVVCRSGINQMSHLFPLNGISCTSVCPQADSCKAQCSEWTISSSEKVTYVAAMLSRSGYKYIIQAREKAKVFSWICIFHWFGLNQAVHCRST